MKILDENCMSPRYPVVEFEGKIYYRNPKLGKWIDEKTSMVADGAVSSELWKKWIRYVKENEFPYEEMTIESLACKNAGRTKDQIEMIELTFSKYAANDDHVSLYYMAAELSAAYRKIKTPEKSFEFMMKYPALTCGNAAFLVSLAAAEADCGHYDQARKIIDRAHALHPSFQDETGKMIGSVYRKLNSL